MIADIDLKDLRSIISVVKDTRGFDFSEYAISSFKRRIIRIFEIFNFNTAEELILKIKTDKVFYEKFLKEVTVNTTEMFRDPSFWRYLKDKVIPHLAKNTNIRIWHAACSSGEEVYSMAILLKELGVYDKAIIHASDINEDVIDVAKNGVYYLRNMEVNQNNYQRFEGKGKLDDYYKVDGDKVRFDADLLKNVNFRTFDLVQGTPFSKFDLILCRNVLIYFNLELQDRVVAMFSTCIYTGGNLAIGSKETISWCKSAKAYQVESLEEKVYKKIAE